MVCKAPVLSSGGLCLCRRSVAPLTETNPAKEEIPYLSVAPLKISKAGCENGTY